MSTKAKRDHTADHVADTGGIHQNWKQSPTFVWTTLGVGSEVPCRKEIKRTIHGNKIRLAKIVLPPSKNNITLAF